MSPVSSGSLALHHGGPRVGRRRARRLEAGWMILACSFGMASPNLAVGLDVAGSAGSVVHVRERHTGRPVVEAIVRVEGRAVASTDSSGKVILPLDGPCHLSLTRTGYAPLDTLLAPADTLVLVLTPAPIPLPGVEVEAGRHSQSEDASAAAVPRFADEGLPDVLRRIPGVDVIGAAGGVTVGVRGSSPLATSVWLDGVPLDESRFGGANLGGILPGVLEQIEAYEGWVPLELGVAGMGGIALRTPLPSAQEALVHVGVGSLGRREAGAGFETCVGRGWLLGKVEALAQDNSFAYLDDNATPLNAGDDTLRTRRNNDTRILTVLGTWTRQLRSSRWTVTSLTTLRHEGVPGPGANPVCEARHESRAQRVIVRHERLLPSRWHAWAMGFADRTASTVRDPRAELTHMGGTIDNEGWGGGARAWLARSVGGVRPLVVVDTRLEEFRTETPPGGTRTRHERRTLSPGAGLTLHPSSLFQARAEGRVAWQWDSTDGQGVRRDMATGRFACEASFRRLAVLLSLAAQGRSPTLVELFGTSGSVKGNTRLKPERGTQQEAVVSFAEGALRASLYRKDVHNLITYWLRSPKVVMPENVGEARMVGLEITVTLRVRERLTAEVFGAFQETEDRSPVPYYHGKALPGWPSRRAGMAARLLLWRGGEVGVDVEGRSKIPIDRANRRWSQGRTTWGAWGELVLLRGLLLSVGGENLSDKKGLDRWGYPEPGRRLRCRVSARF